MYDELMKQFKKLSDEEKNALLVYKTRLGLLINDLDNEPDWDYYYERYKRISSSPQNALLQTLIFFFVGFIIIIVSLLITYYTKDRWIMIKDMIGTITTGLDFKPSFFITSMIIIIFLEVFNAIQCGFLGIIWGHKKNNNKIAYSVLYGFIAYILSQSLVLFLTYIAGLFNPTIMDLFKSNIMLDASSFKLLTILAIILYLIIIFLMSILCKKEFNKGVDIE